MKTWQTTALLVLGAALCRAPSARGEDNPMEAPIRAILLEDDAGLRKVYDGVRKGLELAQLPRVALDTLKDDPEAFAEYGKSLVWKQPPLLFLVGRRAGLRAVEANLPGKRVFVDVAVSAGGAEYPAAVSPKGTSAVVRGVVPAEKWGEVVRGMFPGRSAYPVRLPWPDAAQVEAVVAAADLRLLPDTASTRPGPVIVTDDLGRWGKGAVVVLATDHRLLGRVAAEAGRRLFEGEPSERLTIGATELRVDLDAADAAGVRLPLPFVAAADVVRGRTRRER
jgi:hypothetical protein